MPTPPKPAGMATIPATHEDIFETAPIATIASFLPSGHPQVTPVWVDYDGEHVLVVTRKGARKHENVKHDPRVTVTAIDPEDRHRYVEIRGEVEVLTEEGARAFSDRMARRYWGVEENPIAPDRPRVLLKIRPERVVAPTVETPPGVE